MRLTGSLAWKLTIWFLLLSFFPIMVMAVFVRQNVADAIEDVVASYTQSRVMLLAREITGEADTAEVQGALTVVADDAHKAYLLGDDGKYVAHSDPGAAGQPYSADLSLQVVDQILAGGSGVIVDNSSRTLYGFTRPDTKYPAVVVEVNSSVISSPMVRIERTGLIQLAASLVLVSTAGGAAIWIFFRPIQKLSVAAREIGSGDLSVEIDSSGMEGELGVLANAFNQMTAQLRDAYIDLERQVASRTAELRRTNEALLTLINASPLPIVALDSGGHIRIWNPAARNTFGWTEDEAIRRHHLFLESSDLDETGVSLDSALQGEVISGLETHRPRKDGTIVDIAIWTAPLRDAAGGITGVMGVMADLTERRKAERAVREAEDKYRNIFDNAVEGIYQSSSEGETLTANPALARIFQYLSPDDLQIQMTYISKMYVQPDRRDEFIRILEESEKVTGFESEAYRRDGSIIWISESARAVRNEFGTLLYYEGSIQEITERKEAEQTVRDLAVLGERNRLAREIHDTLAQGFTGIVLQLEAAEQILDESPSEVADHLDKAKTLGRHCLQEARRSVWDLAPQALEEQRLVDALPEEIRRWDASGEETARFTLVGEERTLHPNVQRTLLRICQESLVNVRKHARASNVDVTLAFHPEAVGLEVRDDGIGYDRNKNRPVSDTGGFGITGMEQRTRLLNGTLDITPRDGGGTTVQVRLPTQ
jgi:PAS domain S-box-containing protein